MTSHVVVDSGTTLTIDESATLDLGDNDLTVQGSLEISGAVEGSVVVGEDPAIFAAQNAMENQALLFFSDDTEVITSLTIDGGSINASANAVTIYSGSATMTSGSITATTGTAVAISDKATFAISGGTVTAGSGVAIDCGDAAIFTIAGLGTDAIIRCANATINAPSGYHSFDSTHTDGYSYLDDYYQVSQTISGDQDWKYVEVAYDYFQVVILDTGIVLTEDQSIPVNTKLTITSAGSLDTGAYTLTVEGTLETAGTIESTNPVVVSRDTSTNNAAGSLIVSGGAINSVNSAAVTLENEATCTMSGGTLASDSNSTATTALVVIGEDCTFTMSGGLIQQYATQPAIDATAGTFLLNGTLDQNTGDSSNPTIWAKFATVVDTTTHKITTASTTGDGYYLTYYGDAYITGDETWDDLTSALSQFDEVTLKTSVTMTEDYSLEASSSASKILNIAETGTLTIQKGAILTIKELYSSDSQKAELNNAGAIVVEDGYISLVNSGIFNMTGGTMSSTDTTMLDVNYGTFNMSGGKITSSTATCELGSSSTFCMKDGTIAVAALKPYGTSTMSGGTIEGYVANYGDFTMTDGTIDGGASTAFANYGSSAAINGGTITSSASNYTFYNTNSKTITVSGGIIANTGTGNAIYVNSGSLSITATLDNDVSPAAPTIYANQESIIGFFSTNSKVSYTTTKVGEIYYLATYGETS